MFTHRILTILHEDSSQAGDTAHHHADTQGPPPAGTVHGGPQDDVGGQLHSSGQEEVEELVTTEYGGVVGQPHVHAGVGKPVGGNNFWRNSVILLNPTLLRPNTYGRMVDNGVRKQK